MNHMILKVRLVFFTRIGVACYRAISTYQSLTIVIKSYIYRLKNIIAMYLSHLLFVAVGETCGKAMCPK